MTIQPETGHRGGVLRRVLRFFSDGRVPLVPVCLMTAIFVIFHPWRDQWLDHDSSGVFQSIMIGFNPSIDSICANFLRLTGSGRNFNIISELAIATASSILVPLSVVGLFVIIRRRWGQKKSSHSSDSSSHFLFRHWRIRSGSSFRDSPNVQYWFSEFINDYEFYFRSKTGMYPRVYHPVCNTTV